MYTFCTQFMALHFHYLLPLLRCPRHRPHFHDGAAHIEYVEYLTRSFLHHTMEANTHLITITMSLLQIPHTLRLSYTCLLIAIAAATPLRDPSPNQRTSVKASPDLSDIRRSKARTAHNTRSNRLLCCNCHIRPPAQAPTCARSGLPMHPGCVQNGTQPPICQSCDTCILDIHDEL